MKVAHHSVSVASAKQAGYTVISVFTEPRRVDPDGNSRRWIAIPDILLYSVAERIAEYLEAVRDDQHGT